MIDFNCSQEERGVGWRSCVTTDTIPLVYTSFSVVHVNAGPQGLRRSGQLEQLTDLLSVKEIRFDAAVVSETWLKGFDLSSHGIPDFTFVAACREGSRRGGGVGIYVHSSCRIISWASSSSVDGNIQAVRVHLRRHGFEGHLVGIYSNHRENEDSLLDLLEDFLPRDDTLPSIVTGDTNINLLEAAGAEQYESFFLGRGYRHVVDQVTRPMSGSCLDHIAVANCENFLDIRPMIYRTSVFSDHYPVLLTLTGKTELTLTASEASYQRVINKASMSKFRDHLSATDWSPVHRSGDAEDALNRFSTIVFDVFDRCVPLQNGKVGRKRPDGFHFGDGLKRLRRDVDKAHARYIKYRTDDAKSTYYRKRRRYRSALRSARENFYAKKFDEAEGKPARLWELINGICGRGKKQAEVPSTITTELGCLTDSTEIVDALNRHFSSIGLRTTAPLREQSTNTDEVMRTLWHAAPNSFSLVTVDEQEMRVAMQHTRADLRGSPTEVPSRLLKLSNETLASPLAHIYNLSVTAGHFPVALKASRLIPLYKGKGARDDLNNYRPIALVSYLSKVFERLAKGQMEQYLERRGFFSRSQFGFRRARSTELALTHLWQEIVDANEAGELCLAVFLDVAKAFDCIDHRNFQKMLSLIGCSKTTVAWFNSYLKDRRQAVSIGGLSSQWELVRIGTPQGSVLGPFMFILYMNFIILSIQGAVQCRSIVYADDTTLLFRVNPRHLNDDLRVATSGVKSAMSQFEKLGLVVNAKKTLFVLFRSAQRGLEVDPAVLSELAISLSPSATCLGVCLNEHMKWDSHVDALTMKCYAVISSLRRLRQVGATTTVLLKAYKALFEPILGYCIAVWGGGYDSVMNRVRVLQNDAVRALFGRKRRDSVRHLYLEHDILTADQLIAVKRSAMIFRMQHGGIPQDICFPFEPLHARETRHAANLRVPKVGRELSRQSPRYCLPTIWNSLPSEIRSLSSAETFRSRVREHVKVGSVNP